MKCTQTKIVTPETWPYRKGRDQVYKANGLVCLACEQQRKREYEARRDKITAMVAAAEAKTADPKEAKSQAKLDAAKALKAGGRVLNEYAPAVLARLLQYAEDPDHPQHAWALDKLVDRILPKKLYEELGGQAAGIGLEDKRPVYVVQVVAAQPEAAPTRVIEGEVTEVKVLPSPEPTKE